MRKENYAERDRTRLLDSTETNGLCVGALGTDNDRGRIVAEPAHCAATAVDLGLGRNRGELHSLLLRRSLRVDVLCRTDLGWIPTTRAVVGFFWAGVDGRRLPDPGNRGVDSVVSDAKLRGGNRVLQNGDRASRVVRCGHLGRKYESRRSDWNSRELIGRCFVVDVGGMAGVVACRACQLFGMGSGQARVLAFPRCCIAEPRCRYRPEISWSGLPLRWLPRQPSKPWVWVCIYFCVIGTAWYSLAKFGNGAFGLG